MSPVVLFVHARPLHAQRTLEALRANDGAMETDLYIFADAARNAKESKAVEEVRSLARAVSGFRSVQVIERETNLGLARNILDGVTSVAERHGRAIVLEDDIVTSRNFLRFMNEALDRYEDDPRIWHVNGWTYPVKTQSENRAFLTPVMECWGWATWKDRWQQYRKDPDRLLGSWDRKTIRRFNIEGGYNYWTDVRRNADGSVSTWAVFWYATIFERGGLCVSPPQSYTVNIGIDGSGVNSGNRNIFADVVAADEPLPEWPIEIAADTKAWAAIRDFLLSKRPWFGRRLASQLKWRLKGVAARAR
jgi:GT2 family glycosyltransferase